MTENTVKNVEVEGFDGVLLKGNEYETLGASKTKSDKLNVTTNSIQPRLTTEELALLLRIKPQTVRAGLCRSGHYLGMRPAVKLPNRRLLWDAEQVAAVING